MSELIRIEHVDYVYTTHNVHTYALKDINLTVRAGEYLIILGHNGSGKSTLARLMNGLLTPTAGQVTVAGWSTTNAQRLRDIRQRVGMVFQSPDNQLIASTVEEDVAFGLENLGISYGEMVGRIQQALVTVGMWEHRQRPPNRLSAGQKQRVAIAGVLAMRPECLVLDEATSMLDPAGRQDVLRIARDLHRDGAAIVSITHNMEEALEADRIAILCDGALVLAGSPRDIFSQPLVLGQLDLDLPPVAALAHELHRRDNRFPAECLTVADLIDAFKSAPRAAFHSRQYPIEGRSDRYRNPPYTPSVSAEGVETDGGRHGSRPYAPLPTEESPFFIARNLNHAYGRGTPFETVSLQDISLAIRRGETIGVIGPTGSGKSTLLQHLCGLIRPQKGRVWVDRLDLADGQTDLRAVRQRVGMVFQLPEDQVFERYVGDDVAFAPRNQGLERVEIRERVREAMGSVGLPFEAFKDRLSLSLSGGERRKVALAGVLAMRPEALLLDEPTAGLDPQGRKEFLAYLKRWQAERGLTLVISSHNMNDLAYLADRIYVVHQGRLALQGPVRDVFGQASVLRELGLALPDATAIVEGLIEAGWPLRPGALSIEEAADAIEAAWQLEGAHG